MPRRRIRTHYEQLSEFETGRIIGLKDGGWANRRIACHIGRSEVAIRRFWQEWVDNGRFRRHDGFSDEYPFHLCPDDHRRCVWRRPRQRANPTFTIARHTGPQTGVMDWGVISFDRPFWSSLVAHLWHRDTSTTF
ncbi:uncharacterized protein TNCV_720111 [Trichonephila clavipes]|nr:uncharacterized protein TNCV_720111 [Trichonephila clavipes]